MSLSALWPLQSSTLTAVKALKLYAFSHSFLITSRQYFNTIVAVWMCCATGPSSAPASARHLCRRRSRSTCCCLRLHHPWRIGSPRPRGRRAGRLASRSRRRTSPKWRWRMWRTRSRDVAHVNNRKSCDGVVGQDQPYFWRRHRSADAESLQKRVRLAGTPLRWGRKTRGGLWADGFGGAASFGAVNSYMTTFLRSRWALSTSVASVLLTHPFLSFTVYLMLARVITSLLSEIPESLRGLSRKSCHDAAR